MTVRKEVLAEGVELYCGDCLEVLPTLGKFDAVVTDPPYHGVKSDRWDNQWRTDADFLGWADSVNAEMYRHTTSNASIYWFCSPQMAARIEGVIAARFRIINSLVWDKSGSRNGVGGTGIDVTALRGFWTANTERLIFAERPEGDAEAAQAAGYESSCVEAKTSIFGDYLRSEFSRAKVTNKKIAALFPSKTGGMTGCVSNWLLGLNVPTADQYETIRQFLNSQSEGQYLRREYEDLRREYEDLRREYEDMRRPFNVTASDTWGDVWRFPIERNAMHPTQKPDQLMRHIIKASTRPTDAVLDAFMGSGTTGVAAVKLGRKFTGIEIDPGYFDIAVKRISDALKQPDMFIDPPKPAKQEALSL